MAIITHGLHERIERDRNARAECRAPVREIGLLDEVKLETERGRSGKSSRSRSTKARAREQRQSRARKPGCRRAQHAHELGRRQSERQRA